MSGVVNWVNDNVVKPVLNNPVAVLVDVGLMSMGVPPVYAAAAGAGANTAVKGGSAADIVKSALVGGATAYVGGQVSQSVGNAGYGQGISGAAGGAAGGATAAALTGGNIIQSALTGGVTGGAIGGTMQYFAGSGAVNPAAAGSQMTRADYAASVPDNVLADALKTQDPYGYVQKQMGWNGQGTSAGATWDALNDYKAASTPAVQPTTPVAPTAPTVTTPTVTAPPMSIDSALSIANAPGVVDPLGSLIQSMGWSPASSVTSATQVADKFGQQTADQVAKSRMDQLTAQQQSNMNVRVPQLLTEANNNTNIDSIMSKSPDTSSVIKNLGWSDNQFTQEAAQRLIDNYKAESYANNQLATQQADYIKAHQVTPPPAPVVAPVEPTPTPQPATQPSINPNGGIDLGPATPATQQLTPEQVNQRLNNPGSTPVAPTVVKPPNTIEVGNGNYMDQQGNIVDVNGNITHPSIQPGPAQQPTAAADTGFKVDMGGSAGFAENPSSVIAQHRTPNTDLATLNQINDGTAQWNAQANAWEVPAGPPKVVSTEQVTTGDGVPYIVTHFSDGSFTQTQQPVNTGSGSAVVTPQVPIVPSDMNTQPTVAQPVTAPVEPTIQPVNTSSGSAVVTPQVPIDTSSTITQGTAQTQQPTVVSQQPATVTTYNNGTQTVDPNPNAQVTPGNNTGLGPVANVDITGATVAKPPTETVAQPTFVPPPVQAPSTGSSTGTSGNVVVTPQVPINTSSTITQGTEQPLQPLVPTPITSTPPVANVDVSGGGPTTPDTVIHNPAPPVVIPQPTTPTTPTSSTHYGTYSWGTPVKLNIPQGLNPGWIQPTDFYNTNNATQSHYYWGGHPYQPGPTFNPTTYNAVPNAPGTPWGLQQSFNPNYVYATNPYTPPASAPVYPVAP